MALCSTYSMHCTFNNIYLTFSLNSCFPHIVNLACDAMITSLAGMDSMQDSIEQLRSVVQHVSVTVL